MGVLTKAINDDLLNEFRREIRGFHEELEKKIGFDPETEDFVGIRFEDIGKVHSLDLKLNKRYELLEQVMTHIEIYEKEIKELNDKWEGKQEKPTEAKNLEELIRFDKKEMEKLEQSLKNAQTPALEEDDLLGIGFINPSDLECELKELTKLVKKSADLLEKLRKLKKHLQDI